MKKEKIIITKITKDTETEEVITSKMETVNPDLVAAIWDLTRKHYIKSIVDYLNK